MFLLLTLLAMSPMFLIFINKRRFVKLFGFLSIFFTFMFFALPLILIYYYGSFRYIGLPVIFSQSDFFLCLQSLFLFALGFWVLDIKQTFKIKASSVDIVSRVGNITRTATSTNADYAIMATITFTALYFYFSSSYFEFIDGRQEKSDANQIVGLAIISIYFLGTMTLITLVNKKRYAVATMHFFLLSYVALNFAGRVQIILVLLLPILHYFKTFRTFALFFMTMIIVLFPIILNGKSIVYTLFNDPSSLMYIGQYYQIDIDMDNLLSNLGHPIVSLHYSEVTINRIGYRWFWDIIQGFLFYTRIFGFDAELSLTYLNTETIFFVRDSIIPPGYLAFGYIQAGYLGVFVMGIFFRMTGLLAERVNDIWNDELFGREFLLAFLAANTFYAGEVRVLVLTFFLPLIVIIIYHRLSYIRTQSVIS